MGAALIALVSAGLSLSGFGIDANANAPTGAQVVSHAPKQFDFMVYLNLEAVAPKNYSALKRLSNSGELRALPDLQRELKSLVGQLEMGLGMARGAVGVDPVRDVKSVAAWVRYPARGKPDLLVHIRGAFPADIVDKVAATAGRVNTTKVGGRTAILEDGMMLVSARDGSLLFGSASWVRASVRTGARRGGPRRGSSLARAAQLFNRKPFFALVSAPSKTALARLRREIGASADNALADLLSGHRFAALTLRHDGVNWAYWATTAKGVERAEMASRGLLQLMRASHYAGRGLANLFFASVDSYRGHNRELDAVINSKGDLMTLVEEFTGDGKFQEKVSVNRKLRAVFVDATGRSLSDVAPLVGLAPLAAGWAMFMVRANAPAMMHESKSAPPKVRRAPRRQKKAPRRRSR